MTEEQVVTVIIYAALGAVYGVSGYVHSVADGEGEIRPRKFLKTLLVGALAGTLVASQGKEFAAGPFEAAMVIAVPLVDQLWNAARDRHGSEPRA